MAFAIHPSPVGSHTTGRESWVGGSHGQVLGASHTTGRDRLGGGAWGEFSRGLAGRDANPQVAWGITHQAISGKLHPTSQPIIIIIICVTVRPARDQAQGMHDPTLQRGARAGSLTEATELLSCSHAGCMDNQPQNREKPDPPPPTACKQGTNTPPLSAAPPATHCRLPKPHATQ